MKSMTCVVIAAILVVLSSTGHASSVPIISGHGINFAVGNKYQSETDIILDGPVNGLAFRRTYNSQSAENGAMGYGWSHSFSERLVDTSLSITLVKHDGQRVRFPYDAYGNYTTNLGSPQTIVRLSGGGYQLIQADRATRTYDAQGRLTAITQRNGTGITCTWTGAQLSAVTDTLGRMLTFTYANNKLTGVATPAGNFTFTYDSNSNLIRVTRPDGTFRVYEYTDARDIHNLTGIVDEAGIRIQTITYDSSDRVVGSTLADGKDKVTIAYLSAQTRVITDALGNVSTYTLTSLNGMLRVQSMSGSGCSGCGSGTGVSFVYDDWLRPVSSTDANGTVTAYTYAANGSRLTEVEASGMPLARTTTYTYTSQNQVATITRPSASAP
ncbi:MAG: DUF6531 domain-containing protein, partial [Desulfocapsaceae bacterium]|nr:DUF6531 domain-containing protein [Desulfocapsaceae bacterium]